MSESFVWDSILSAIEKRVPHPSFETWFKPIIFVESDDSTIRLRVPDEVFEDMILNNYRYELEESLKEANLEGRSISFDIARMGEPAHDKVNPNSSVPSRVSSLLNTKPPISTPAQKSFNELDSNSSDFPDQEEKGLPLNPEYTFETFVVGKRNALAYQTAREVANEPSKTNPFYIHGGVGLGKTHLLQAIAHEVKRINPHPKFKVYYISAEKFMNEFIDHLSRSDMKNFHRVYRSINVLLIDDIQSWAGKKEATREEFFHTFNELYLSRSQIVLSSDCHPKEIPLIEPRLISRFLGGIDVEIDPPDTETKVKILRNKAERENLILPDNVAFYIAENITSNIRELEGSLNRLKALSSLRGEPISLSLAKEALKNVVKAEDRFISIETVQKVVADHFKIRINDLKSKSRKSEIVEPRQIAMYICRQLTQASFPEIGREFGNRDHSTVMHSCEKIESRYMQEDDFHKLIDNLTTRCQ